MELSKYILRTTTWHAEEDMRRQREHKKFKNNGVIDRNLEGRDVKISAKALISYFFLQWGVGQSCQNLMEQDPSI